jgi:hypothetical protein
VSRKKCKRKHYALMDVVALAIEGACITPDAPLSELQRGEQAYLDALVEGVDDLNGYYGLCAMLGVAETMARNGVGPEVMQACKVAEFSLIKLKNRYDRWGKWDITEGEKHSIRELMEWHHLQRTSVSRGEYEKFIAKATNRMRSKAPEVVTV